MTYEEYLQSQGYFYVPSQGGDDAPRSGWARTVGGGDDSYTQFLEGDNEENTLRGYAQQVQATPTVASLLEPTPTVTSLLEPTPTSTPTPVTATTTPTPKSLDEYLQQKGYEYRPAQGVEDGYGASWGKYRDDGEGGRIFDPLESHVSQQYYNDPSRFTATRESQVGQGINTFNEGNEDQKRVIDQINSGQLYIAPRIERGRGEDQGYAESTSYELRDSKTGNVVNQQVIPIDPSKGIFNVVADDRNSSGFFNNYVSTDPSGFVNPIVSEQQSQYASRKNSSADFYRNSLLASLSMTGLAFPGIGEAIGAATGLGTVGSNVALNTGINAIKQAVTGNFDPLALATSAALSYGLGGADGTDVLTADDLYTGQAMTDLATNASTVNDIINSFTDTGLTAAEMAELTNLAPETGTQFDAYTTPIGSPVIGQPYDVTPLTDPVTGEPFGSIEEPLVDNYMDGFTSVSETGLATLPDEGMQTDLPGTTLLEEIGLYTDGFEPAPRYDFSPETAVLDVSPELDPTGSMATSSGFSITPRQLLAGANIAKSLLGAGQEQAAAPATQFRGTRMPSGQVDYSGILGLLQMQSPQRRSLLG
jgi:hypothetical protein